MSVPPTYQRVITRHKPEPLCNKCIAIGVGYRTIQRIRHKSQAPSDYG
jgi:hypothetical protein